MKLEAIIKGLMLKLEDESINVLKLSKRIGIKNYKEFDKAMSAALDLNLNKIEKNGKN